ncbi:MAG TPA: HtaA domain-containing protein [Solirubrobacteraceae bacterium]
MQAIRSVAVVATPLLFVCAPSALGAASKGVSVKINGGSLAIAFSAKAWSAIDSGSTTAGSHTSAIVPGAEATPRTFVFPFAKGTLNSVTALGTLSAKGGLRTETHLISGLFETASSATATGPLISISPDGATLSMNSPNADPPKLTIFKLALAHAKVLGTRHSVTISKIPAILTSAGAPFFLDGSIRAGQQIATVTIRAKG